MPGLTGDWLEAVGEEFSKPYYRELYDFVKNEYSRYTVYPPSGDIFNAMHYTPLKKVRAVILGQDPYHEPGQAHGLSFSVKPPTAIPPSLRNIYKELNMELGLKIPNNGYLKKWADEGVLLLNAVLTVRAGQAASHQKKGWETFTDAVIRAVNRKDSPVVFMLWGRYAKDKAALLDNKNHLVLTAAHPSPLSANNGFFGCGHFKACNEFLMKNNEEPIDWQIEDIL
ncbi:MAG: uracil-DNA glycosylase [Lachnospiraceae bacterium]|nr:uracil-DNA glycosylase [Lachnospiraceae bacterium]